MNIVHTVCDYTEKVTGRNSHLRVMSTDVRFDELGIDSLDRAGMLIDLEHHYKIDVPDELCARIETVAEMVQCIRDIKAGVPMKFILRDKQARPMYKRPTATGAYLLHNGVVYCRATGQKCVRDINPFPGGMPVVNACKLVKCPLYKKR